MMLNDKVAVIYSGGERYAGRLGQEGRLAAVAGAWHGPASDRAAVDG
jgi:hypothetical protein